MLIRRYFPRVVDMLNTRKLNLDEGKLFKISTRAGVSRLKPAFGNPATGQTKYAANHREHFLAHKLVHNEVNAAPPGETREQLYRRLKNDHGFRHAFSVLQLFIQYPFESRLRAA